MIVITEIEVNKMWPKTKEIYDVLDGYNVAQSILDEQSISFMYHEETFEAVKCQAMIGMNYRINVWENGKVDIFYQDKLEDDQKTVMIKKLDELQYSYRLNRTYRNDSSVKFSFGFTNAANHLRPITTLFEILKVK